MQMVAQQLSARGITDPRILKAFETTPRHYFLAVDYRIEAYSDQPLPIDQGQTISQPYVVALMLEYLSLSAEHRVLEIGGGSGYATALLAQLARSVHSLEVFSSLLDSARTVLNVLGFDNVNFEHGSAWEQRFPRKVYDRIILWASPPRIPEYLLSSLKSGGILVAPEGKYEQYIWIYHKLDGAIHKEKRDEVRFVPLVQGTTNEIDIFR